MMELEKLEPFLIHQFKDERELIQAVERLSFNFTQNRKQINAYLTDPSLVAAYTVFYLSTNLPKWEEVLKWMPGWWQEQVKLSTLIDVGSGPGTFSIAFRTWSQRSCQVIQLETSSLMKQQALKLWQGLFPGENLVQASVPQNWGENSFMLFGHSANEMGCEQVIKYIETIKPKHVLFIEPGTSEFFPKMLELRKSLIDAGFQNLFPCPSQADCPLDKGHDWCHQFIQVSHSPLVERLSQILKKDRRLLPLTVHLYTKQGQTDLDAPIRVIRVLPETKFSFEWEVCSQDMIKSFQVMKRGLSKTSLKRLTQVRSGDKVEATIDKTLEFGVRVKIISINNCALDA